MQFPEMRFLEMQFPEMQFISLLSSRNHHTIELRIARLFSINQQDCAPRRIEREERSKLLPTEPRSQLLQVRVLRTGNRIDPRSPKPWTELCQDLHIMVDRSAQLDRLRLKPLAILRRLNDLPHEYAFLGICVKMNLATLLTARLETYRSRTVQTKTPRKVRGVGRDDGFDFVRFNA